MQLFLELELLVLSFMYITQLCCVVNVVGEIGILICTFI